MNKQTEALKMAIELLEEAEILIELPNFDGYKKAIQSCKEALEQPAQEPVAWMYDGKLYWKKQCKFFSKDIGQEYEGQIPLYTHPAPNKVLNENTPDKVWQGLSDDEIQNIYEQHPNSPLYKGMAQVNEFARAIEVKLKEKNGC